MDYFPPTNTSSSSSFGGREKKKPAGKRSKGTVKLSTDPQSVAARERRHRISDRFKILQSMVPGGTKMDTVSMLDEAIQYVKFLKTQIWLHQTMINFVDEDPSSSQFSPPASLLPCSSTEQSFYSNTTSGLLPTAQLSSPSPPLLPFEDSGCFQQGEQSMRYDAYMNNN